MESKIIFENILQNLDEVINFSTPEAKALWEQFISFHPADIALFFARVDRNAFSLIFNKLPGDVRVEVFSHFSEPMRALAISFLSDEDKEFILRSTDIDELTDLFEYLSDEELKKYLSMLTSQDRKMVLSILKFEPDSAGGIMDVDVFSLVKDMTVSKIIHVLQRLKPEKEVHDEIYVTDRDNKLIGHIHLRDLVMQNPNAKLEDFFEENELVALADQDQEEVVKQMLHYSLMTIPVVDKEGHFLGVIPTETLVDVIEEEASEDVYKMSAMAPIKYPYFDTSFFKMFYERSFILVALLLAQSISAIISHRYESTLSGFLMFFMTMLTSTGGNVSSQTSAVVIQGMAAGEIDKYNFWRFLKKEFFMAAMIALVVGIAGFGRVYATDGNVWGSLTVSLALAVIVMTSVVFGSCIPLILKSLKLDPAFSAGPFLATVMDILGLLIYCYIGSWLLA
ncbi:MAG: Magnesium transporter [candidate division TM6 bacterium GW2011_GWF2_32_72]|nr:MAG: Magnesium transporter [candidate division TM6 bacterium GW2011_GWF2_32_72]